MNPNLKVVKISNDNNVFWDFIWKGWTHKKTRRFLGKLVKLRRLKEQKPDFKEIHFEPEFYPPQYTWVGNNFRIGCSKK